MDDTRVSDSQNNQDSETAEVSRPELSVGPAAENRIIESSLTGVSPWEVGSTVKIGTEEYTITSVDGLQSVVEQTAEKALKTIRARSYSERHPELGKMMKCQICKLRHRAPQCEQKFATGRYDLRDPKPELIAGQTDETKPLFNSLKVTLGRAMFAKKRRKPHHNFRTLQFVELVRSLVPDEYTKEDLEKARKRASRILAKKHGRHGYLPPVWMDTKKEEHKKKLDIVSEV